MQFPDVNVLIYAHREEAPEHSQYAAWLMALTKGPSPFGMSELVASGFLRIVTNPKAFLQPSPLEDALAFLEELYRRPNCKTLRPGPGHWRIFADLCRRTTTTGKRVADAYHAALAIEHGCELVTADGDFARFPTLRWRHPLRPPST